MFIKSISNAKNLPEIKDKKSTLRSGKSSVVMQNTSFVSFQNVNQIIINTETLPIQLITNSLQIKQLQIYFNTTHVIMKNSQESHSHPLPSDLKKWLKLTFGKENCNIEVRAKFNENKINKKNIFGSFMSWKNTNNDQLSQLTSLNIEHWINQLRQKINNHAKPQLKSQGKISGFIKSKISQRKGLSNQKTKSILSKFSEVSIHTAFSKQLSACNQQSYSIDRSTPKQTNAGVSLKKFHDRKQKFTKREINTCSQNRMSETVSRFVHMKLAKGIDNATEGSTILFPKETTIQAITTLPKQKRYRPKFCDEMPLSVQELQQKRKKFDSQFMTKVQNTTNLQTDIKTNESEVKQQIIKQNDSQVSHLQDTFQRGICHNKNLENNNRDVQESGTLCQSVFQ